MFTGRPLIFLLMGQSNMAGRGLALPSDAQPTTAVGVLDGQGTRQDATPQTKIAWRPASHPIHHSDLDREFGPELGRFGLGLPFAHELIASQAAAEIGLIPCAWGGAPIDLIGPGSPTFINALERAHEARSTGTIAGVLWHQGEADTSDRDSAEQYGGKLTRLIGELREALSTPLLPVIVGDLAPTLHQHRSRQLQASVRSVRAQLRSLPDLVPAVGHVKVDDLQTASDGVHFTRQSLITLGRRYARRHIELRTIHTVHIGGINV